MVECECACGFRGSRVEMSSHMHAWRHMNVIANTVENNNSAHYRYTHNTDNRPYYLPHYLLVYPKLEELSNVQP